VFAAVGGEEEEVDEEL